ncbi:MAG: hypothetical protein QXD89_02180 [Candidatus Aenigmatarchaeota archaeon]
MEFKIVQEKYNPFLKRRELEIFIVHPNSPTPSKENVKSFLKEKYNADDSQIEIKCVISKAGLPQTLVKARIYVEKRGEKNETCSNKSE